MVDEEEQYLPLHCPPHLSWVGRGGEGREREKERKREREQERERGREGEEKRLLFVL